MSGDDPNQSGKAQGGEPGPDATPQNGPAKAPVAAPKPGFVAPPKPAFGTGVVPSPASVPPSATSPVRPPPPAFAGEAPRPPQGPARPIQPPRPAFAGEKPAGGSSIAPVAQPPAQPVAQRPAVTAGAAQQIRAVVGVPAPVFAVVRSQGAPLPAVGDAELLPYAPFEQGDEAEIRRFVREVDLADGAKVWEFGTRTQERAAAIPTRLLDLQRAGRIEIRPCLVRIQQTLRSVRPESLIEPGETRESGLMGAIASMRRMLNQPNDPFRQALDSIKVQKRLVEVGLPAAQTFVADLDALARDAREAHRALRLRQAAGQIILAHWKTVGRKALEARSRADRGAAAELEAIDSNAGVLEGRIDSLRLSLAAAGGNIPTITLAKDVELKLVETARNTILTQIGLWEQGCSTALVAASQGTTGLTNAVVGLIETQANLIKAIEGALSDRTQASKAGGHFE